MPRRLRNAALLALVTVVLLELVLQVLSFGYHVASQQEASEVSVTEGENLRLLCVGDSYTFGDGASDPALRSYPMALRGRLRAQLGDEGLEVVNVGKKGNDSAGVLRGLSSALETARPHVVCVLIGCNDAWNRPERVDSVGGADASFRWEWRTGRLLRLAFRRHEMSWEETGPPAANQLQSGPPSDAMRAVAAKLIADGGVRLGPYTPTPTPQRSKDHAQTLADNRGRLARGEHAAVLDAARGVLADVPSDSTALMQVVSAAATTDREVAEQSLAALRAVHADDPTERHGVDLLQALFALGKIEEVAEFAPRFLAEHPSCREGWKLLADAEYRRDKSAAAAAYERFFAVGGELQDWMANSISNYAQAIAPQDSTRAAALISAGILLNGSLQGRPWSIYLVCARNGTIPLPIAKALPEIEGLDDRGRALLRQAVAEAFSDGESSWQATLDHNLRVIAREAANAGARPVFVTYPFFARGQEEIIERVAKELGAPLVQARARFDEELKTKTRAELFAADGHCNDAGYDILAEEVAKVVLPMLSK